MRGHERQGERRWRNRDLVRERDRRGTRGMWLWGLGLALAVLPTATYVVEQARCTRLAYESDALRAELERLTEIERRLQVEQARLESLGEIETWALDRHGMVRPGPEQIVVVTTSPSSRGR